MASSFLTYLWHYTLARAIFRAFGGGGLVLILAGLCVVWLGARRLRRR